MPQTKKLLAMLKQLVFQLYLQSIKLINQMRIRKSKERLAGMNLLVEDWGGKIQSHDISAKVGTGVKNY
jgi:translation initiation factor IF-2